ncbi:putative nuclease HARBI1 [Odontomachus brunneus]|uniref:putative nuclease HARBI1 n=1 Tax=Odontomachus brunneus TaxID=486640 RepID=UPI0013F23DA3|nr:putative nuclease HARBI1 [Odontomachus brunneus]
MPERYDISIRVALAYLGLHLMMMEDRVQRKRQLLRATEDPFDLTNDEFKELYRLTSDLMFDLIDALEPRLQRTRITGLFVEKQILSAVRFYAIGCFQRPVGEQWGISMSQISISRCIHKVTDAINDLIFRQWEQFPISPGARQLARMQFQNARQPFEGALGAIDCTHIAIFAPNPDKHEEAYVNHHGYHSLNVQMICDPNLKILNVNARYPGARHDAYIWNDSAARRVMERAYNRGERRAYFIGDSGYPLEPWLLTPLPREPEGTPRFAYNEALCSARNCIERLFNVLKSTWRCHSRHRVLQYEPGFAGKIVNACAVFHNMRNAHVFHNMRNAHGIFDNDLFDELNNIHMYENCDDVNINLDNVHGPLAIARRIQDRLIAERFGR